VELFVSERRDCLVVEDDPWDVVWEDIGSTRGGDVGSEKASAGSLSPSAVSLLRSVDSPSASGFAKEASTSYSSRSTEMDREVADPSEDLESEEEGQRFDSCSGDDLEAEEGVETEEKVEPITMLMRRLGAVMWPAPPPTSIIGPTASTPRRSRKKTGYTSPTHGRREKPDICHARSATRNNVTPSPHHLPAFQWKSWG
jgi:hypothetical protein